MTLFRIARNHGGPVRQYEIISDSTKPHYKLWEEFDIQRTVQCDVYL